MGILNAVDITPEVDVSTNGRIEILHGRDHYLMVVSEWYEFIDGILVNTKTGEPVTIACKAEQRRVNVLEGDMVRQRRINERLIEVGGVHRAGTNFIYLLASPDITHMVVAPVFPSPLALGYALTCDPHLPPNTIAVPDVVRAGG